MNGYDLSRAWFDFCFENPDKIKPIHTAIYFFAIEHCNRLGWKEKFGFPSQMVMEAIGIKNWRTYSKGLNDLVEFGFIKMIEISKNQYSSNIVAIVKNTKAHTKALDKALSKHVQKHSTKQGQSTVSINKQLNKEQLNKEQESVLYFSNLKKETWKRWTDFKNSQFKFKYKSIESEQIALNELIKFSNDINAKAELIINQSIAKGWKGLFELKIDAPQKENNKTHIPPSNWQDAENDPNKLKF